ncbi:MAG: phosphopantetheine-binding protein [Verrucomicrobiota bacterium]
MSALSSADNTSGMANVSIDELKQLLMENCMLNIPLEEIKEDLPLFGPDGLGLDSIDALQITVALEKKYKATIPNPDIARQVLQNLGSLREWLLRQTA